MKKIYFACSIRGGRDDQPIYAEIVKTIKQNGIVLSELFVDKKLTAQGSPESSDYLRKRCLDWIIEADGIIAEVTNPSLGVGYEIASAENLGKPILALFRPSSGRKLSAMVGGSPHLKLVEYEKPQDLDSVLKRFIDSF